METEDILEQLPEPVRREVEEFDRRARRDARMETALALAALAGFAVAVLSLLGILLGW